MHATTAKTGPEAGAGPGRVLAIKPGTTSTKFGIYSRAGEEWARNIHHEDDELARFRGRPMLDRL